MSGGDAAPPAALQDRMHGDHPALFENAQLVRPAMHLDDALPGAVGTV